MTVVAIGHGATYNLLLADSCAIAANGEKRTVQKVLCVGSNTFVSALGKAGLLHAVGNVASWADPIELDYLDPKIVDVCVACLRKSWRALGLTAKHEVPALQNLAVCTREMAAYWELRDDGSKRLHDVPRGRLVILYGGKEPIDVSFTEELENPWSLPLQAITNVHRKDFEQPEAQRWLPYALDGRYGGIVLPRDAGRPYIRRRPFSSLCDLIAEQSHDRESLLNDPAFMSFPELEALGLTT